MDSLLPQEGLICVAQQLDKGFKHYFIPREQALKWAMALDQAGKTVFIAQGSFLTADSRKGDNTAYFRNFFLDIDCGEKKPYLTKKEGIQALNRFVEKAKLPAPAVVSSGNGLYAHWVFDRDMASADWHRNAMMLQKLVQKYEPGLDMDGIVSDRARVLRPVGATHRKDPTNPKTVTLLRDCAPLDTNDLVRKIKDAYTATGEHLPVPKAVNSEFLSGLSDSRPSSAEQIATKCAQIAHIRDTKGDVAEPLWYAAVGLLRHCSEGSELIHLWSSGHPDYTKEGTDAKIAQHERANVGPTTCAKLNGENSGVCDGCRHAAKIVSPIVLGYALPVPLERSEETAYPDPPSGFTISETGVYYNDDTPRQIYPYPVWVSSVNVDHFGESVSLKHRLPHEGWREVTVASNKLTEQKSFFSVLLDAHVHVVGKDNKGLFMAYIETFMSKLRAEQKLAKLSGQMGWSEEPSGLAFVHGDSIYRQDGMAHKVGYSATAPDFVRSMKPVGELGQWAENTKILNQEGLEGLAFEFLCTAFGAPLVRFTGFEGAMLSIVGDSGIGKTLVGKWGLSAWGDPQKLMLTRDDTKNALVGRLGVYNTLPAYIDEISNIPADELSDLAYKLTQGRDKLRLSRNAAERTNVNQWNLLAVVSSNHSLMDKLALHKGHATAEINRIFEYEITTDSGLTSEEGKQIFQTMDGNYGNAGRVYAQWLVENQEQHKAALEKITDMLCKKAHAQPDERFWFMTGAVAIYGGMIARKLGLSHVNVEALIPWVVSTIRGMRRYKKAQSFDPVSFLGAFLDKYSSRILVVASYDPKDKIGQTGYREPHNGLVARVELDKMRLWVSGDVLRQDLQKLQVSSRKVAGMLHTQGLVSTNERITLGRGTLWSGVAQNCWVFDLNEPALGHKALAIVNTLKEGRDNERSQI